ncbi:hypothetical protein C4D60_Mb06t26620 [Musa balbisiana]|uniref:Rieske domain-containing protein n=1 Tax=Musa balbisiana TaxID=52838 RepID=A0A4S8IR06_MUSBA|nr:hypothetical protein C4D60_Mb06t26620 [Musa balbisiana]
MTGKKLRLWTALTIPEVDEGRAARFSCHRGTAEDGPRLACLRVTETVALYLFAFYRVPCSGGGVAGEFALMLHAESGAANQEGSYRIIKPHKSPRRGVTSCQSGILAATVAPASTGIMVFYDQWRNGCPTLDHCFCVFVGIVCSSRMDPRSWLWKRKSPEKSPGETESSGSVSSHSERYSDDQEGLRASPNDTSIHADSPEISSNNCDGEVHESVKRLTEKLSAALLNISAKEDLVKQHAKVTEEAVSGWEQAEAEVAALKQQLETAVQKNSALEDNISQLDGALKECVRQLRQLREEQEEKVHDSITKKTHEWDSEKQEFEKQLVELKTQLEDAKTEVVTLDHELQARLEAVEKENMALKTELHSQSEDLQVLLLERELSNKAAETASKQHLESIKKVGKLEAECHQLRSINRRLSSVSNHKPIASSVCVKSLTDSQSDSSERLIGMDSEPGCSDLWASALIAELDQFRNEKGSPRNLTTSVDIELMDDFLEMERLVALPEIDHGSSGFGAEVDSFQVVRRDSQPRVENEILHRRLIELEEKVEILEHEKAELEISLADSHNRPEMSCNLLTAAEDKIVELQREIDLANESKEMARSEVMNLEGRWKELETQLESASSENVKLYARVSLLEESFEAERALSDELKSRIKISEDARQALDSQLKSAHLEARSLYEKVGLLECQVKEGRALSSELAAKEEALEATIKALESQLEHASSEVRMLQERASFWELKAEEEMILSAEFAIKLEATEATRKKLELDLKSAHEFATEVEAAETAKKALETQLESAHIEVMKLSKKVVLLERQIDEERAMSAECASKCHKLEDDLLRIKREADLWRVTNSNRERKIKQEKELALAAGKLEECQKTIASLNQQLKSLTTLDDFMFEAVQPEHNIGLANLSGTEADDLHHIDSSENVGGRGGFRVLAVFGDGEGGGTDKKNTWGEIFDVEVPRPRVQPLKGKFLDVNQALEVARMDIQYCDWRARQDVLSIMLLHEKVVEVLNPLARDFKSIGTMKKELAELQEDLEQAHRQVHISEARVAAALDKLAYMESLVSDRLLQEKSSCDSSIECITLTPSTSSASKDPVKSKSSRRSLNVSGPVQPYHPSLKNFWYPVAFSKDLKDDTMIPIDCFEEPWVIFRGKDGNPGCIRNTCAHRACPLHLGSVNEGRIQCPYHGWEYSTDGKCEKMPSTRMLNVRIRSLPCFEHEGMIWIWPGSAPPTDTLPSLQPPTGFMIHAEIVMELPVEHGLLLDNLLDLAHAPFTHTTTFAKGWNVPSLVKFLTPASGLQGYWDPYPIDMEFRPPCIVLSTIGISKPGKLEGRSTRQCSTHLHQLHVLNEDLRLVVGQQDRMINGANVWNSPVSYDKLGIRYRLWRDALERGVDHLSFTKQDN